MLKGRQNIFRHTVVARKVVGKSASDNPDRIVDGFEYCSPKKFERTAREVMDVCSRVLMESNKRRFDSYSRSKQCIDHIPYYYIHTEKYSPKSYVVNFRLANQRSERWFSHVKKMIRPIRIANDVFSHVRKMIRPIRSHRTV